MSSLTPEQQEVSNDFLDGMLAFLIALLGAITIGYVTGNSIVMAVGAVVVIATGIQHLTGFLNTRVISQP